ncbi:AlpA family phage regulatory protein [Propionibacterium freudenreichii]|uniref:helix-turn-helix transcriptional regulator n=1 Tax=Propionibacterium freudenreichii TaxID=1744 RepID=UPI000541DF85|nr:AlpA family phage regulatory protein [Propionibacterium freudenreichii]MCT2999338.1 AlpA family phage regulatory protein [Propionibacterium freudenreichii]MDK9644893.1 AlpA family phage regulatory protein [Propionibacterium freudenreichii]CEG85767.1 Putative uncharacterized protein [Propionibacterium freudenreichii]CEI24861.1 Putative uncharacterized protein [Propionibacterium freudenreichii]
MDDQLLTAADIERLTNGVVKQPTLRWWRHKNDGTGPKSFRIGGRKVAYKKSDVLAWLEREYAKADETRAA